jgi:ketosteroid isomerase-like protein
MDVRYPGINHTAEIQHVQVKGNNALAVARQHLAIPDKGKGKTTTRDLESVFLLKKNAKGEWKITGWLGAASWKREVTDL